MMYPPIWISMSKSTGGTYSSGCQMLGSPTFGPGKGNKSLFNDGRWKLPSTVFWKEADHSFSLSPSPSLSLSLSLSLFPSSTGREPLDVSLTHDSWHNASDRFTLNGSRECANPKQTIKLIMTRRKTGRERKVFHSTLLLHKKKKSHAYPSPPTERVNNDDNAPSIVFVVRR